MKSFNTHYIYYVLVVLIVSSIGLSGQDTQQPANSASTSEGSKKKENTYFKPNYQHKNIGKINSVALGFSNLSLFYERAFYPRITASLGAGYKFNGKPASLYKNDNFDIDVNMSEITGFGIAGEVRYYIKTCENNIPAGFYASLYSKYTNYNSTTKFDFTPSSGADELAEADLKLREWGVGLQLGYQLPILDRFVIDFMFFGPRYSFLKLTGNLTHPVSDEFKSELEDYINDVIDRLGSSERFNLKDASSNSITGRMQLPNFRFGLSLGYSF